MRINRLIETTIILLNRKTVTARTLANRFGVTTRTVYRDVEVLSAAGIPVYTTSGNGGGISLLSSFSIDKALLSREEGERLLMAVRAMAQTKFPEIDTLLDKLGALFSAPADWIQIDFNEWGSNPNEKNKFSDIRSAVIGKNVIRFDYVNANGEKSSRSVEPEKLIFQKDAWYLLGHCRKRGAGRLFRLSRMKNVTSSGERFTTRATANPSFQGQNTCCPVPETLKLQFKDNVLNRLYDSFDESFMRKNQDGSIEVSIPAAEDEWLYGYIMSFGKNVTVIEPAHIRDEVASRLREAALNYD